MRKKHNPIEAVKDNLRHMVVDLDSMSLPESIVDMEKQVDIFSLDKMPKILNKFPGGEFDPDMSMSRSEYQEIFKQLEDVSNEVEAAKIKLSELSKCFYVGSVGTEFDKRYKVIFGDEEKYEEDEHTRLMMSSFIKRYSLDITSINDKLRMAKNLVEAKLLRGKPNYCEVDLFEKEKEPVEC